MPTDFSLVESTKFIRLISTGFNSEFLSKEEPSSKGKFQIGTKADINSEPMPDGFKIKLDLDFIATGFSVDDSEIYKFQASYIAAFELLGINAFDENNEPEYVNYLLSLAWLPMREHIVNSLEISGFLGVMLPLSPPTILESLTG